MSYDPSSPELDCRCRCWLARHERYTLSSAGCSSTHARAANRSDLQGRRIRAAEIRPCPLARRRRGVHDRRTGRRRCQGEGLGNRPIRCGDGRPYHPGSRVPPGPARRVKRRCRSTTTPGLPTRRSSSSLPTPGRSGGRTRAAITGCWIFVRAARSRSLVSRRPSRRSCSPSSRPMRTRVGYVRANNIYVERLADGVVTQITSDGSETTINGTVRLGVRRRAWRSGWLSLEPRRQGDCLLAVRHHGRRCVFADQQHRRALSIDHTHSVSESRYHEFSSTNRCRERRRW